MNFKKLFRILDDKFTTMWRSDPKSIKEITRDWHVYVCAFGAHLTNSGNLDYRTIEKVDFGYVDPERKLVYLADSATIRDLAVANTYVVLDFELAFKTLAIGGLP